MTQVVTGVTVPSFMKKFDADYLPHQEWMLLAAYTYATSTPDPDSAIDVAPFSKKEKSIIKELVVVLGFYNNRTDHYLTWDYEITKAQADCAHTRIVQTFGNMVNYYGDVLKKVEEYYEGGFFDWFEYIFTDAAREFAWMVWHQKDMRTIEFAEHAMIDFFVKFKFDPPKWKPSVHDIPFDKDATRAIVLGDLLKFYHRTQHAYWLNADSDPRKKGSVSVLPCKHNDFILNAQGIPLCEICDADIVFGYGI